MAENSPCLTRGWDLRAIDLHFGNLPGFACLALEALSLDKGFMYVSKLIHSVGMWNGGWITVGY